MKPSLFTCIVSIGVACAGLGAASATKPEVAPNAMPEQTYEQFISSARERFPGPFDEQAFQRDHPTDAWQAVKAGSIQSEPLFYSVDGLRITGVVVRPRDGKKLPILIWSRGGVGQARIDPPQIVEMGWWAERGYVVVASNFRGAGGSEGSDEFGGGDVRDLMALLPIARKLKGVDPNRIYGLGFSRGGMMLLQAAGRGMPFRAIATAGAPTDFSSWIAERSDIDDLLKKMAPDYAAERSNRYCGRSATCWADRLTMPVFIAHGGDDRSVPPTQAGLLAQQMEKAGRPHLLKMIPGGDHGLWGRRQELFTEVEKYFSTAP